VGRADDPCEKAETPEAKLEPNYTNFTSYNTYGGTSRAMWTARRDIARTWLWYEATKKPETPVWLRGGGEASEPNVTSYSAEIGPP